MKPFARYSRQAGDNLSVDDYYLLQIVRWFGGITMTEVAQHLTISKQQATLKVDRLCERGYLKRVPNTEDRRVVKVEATVQAIQETDAHRAYLNGFVDVLREQLSDEEMETFNNGMKMLLSVLPKLD